MAELPRRRSLGAHIAAVSEDVRTGPLALMRAVDRLTPDDLRRGAERARRVAAHREAVADAMEREGIQTLTPGQVRAFGTREVSDADA